MKFKLTWFVIRFILGWWHLQSYIPSTQKQPPEVFCKKRWLLHRQFCEISRNTFPIQQLRRLLIIITIIIVIITIIIRSSDVSCTMEKLTTQSLVVKSIWEFVDGRFINQWSNVISYLPQNILSFTIRYLNNTLANGTNAIKWGITNSSTCIFVTNNKALVMLLVGAKLHS